MILLACFAAIVAGGVIALGLGLVSKKISSSNTVEFGYYFSGSFYAASLSITPAVALTHWDYGKGLPFGMNAGAVFVTALILMAPALSLYPVLAKALGVYRWNVPVMFLIATTMTIAAVLLLKTMLVLHIDMWKILSFGTIAIAVLLIQIALAIVHSMFTRIRDWPAKGPSEPHVWS